MARLSAAILVASLVLAQAGGCGTKQEAPAPLPPAVQRAPTAERPIVVAFDEPETLLIFGGPDGTERRRLPQPKGFCRYDFSAGGRRAGTLTALDPGHVRVTVYDESGEAIVQADLPLPGEGLPSGGLWVSDHAEALVYLEMWLPVAQPARTSATHMDPDAPVPEPTGRRTWFVRPDGAVVDLGERRPREACFPRSPGVAILSGTGWTPGEPGPRFVLTRLGADLEVAWRHDLPAAEGYPHLWRHAQGNLRPAVDFVLHMPTGEEWDFRADGLAARRPRWGYLTLDSRTVTFTVRTREGKPTRTIDVTEISTGWFLARVWLGAGGHLVAAVWEVEYPVWGWPPPEPPRRYLGTWYIRPDGATRSLDGPPPISGSVWADGTYALLAETDDGFALQAYDTNHRPTWRRSYVKTTPDGKVVRGMLAGLDVDGVLQVEWWDGRRRSLIERLTADGRTLPAD